MPAPGCNFRRGWAGQPNVLLSENGVWIQEIKKGRSQINKCSANLQVPIQSLYVVTQPVFCFSWRTYQTPESFCKFEGSSCSALAWTNQSLLYTPGTPLERTQIPDTTKDDWATHFKGDKSWGVQHKSQAQETMTGQPTLWLTSRLSPK